MVRDITAMIERYKYNLSILAIATIGLLTQTASWAQLPKYVRDDVGLCVYAREIPARTEQLLASELRQRIESTSIVTRWRRSNDYLKMQAIVEQVENHSGRSVQELMLSLLGTESLLAVYPSTQEGNLRPSAVFLSIPVDSSATQATLDLWNSLDRAVVEPLGKNVFRRTAKGAQLYYHLSKGLFAFSDREELVTELAVSTSSGFENSLLKSPAWSRAVESLGETNWMIGFAVPARWKAIWGDASQDPIPSMLLHLESLVVGFHGQHGLHYRANLIFPSGQEPTLLRSYRETHAAPEGDWVKIDNNTLFTAFGRGGPDYLSAVLRGELEREKSAEAIAVYEVLRGLLLGRDPLNDVLPKLGSSWQFTLESAEQAGLFPWRVSGEIEFAPADSTAIGDDQPTLQASLSNLLRTSIQLASRLLPQGPGGDRSPFEEQLANGSILHGFELGWGLEPTVGVGSKKLVMAGSREHAKFLLEGSIPDKSTGVSTEISRKMQSSQGGAYLNLIQLRKGLVDHRNLLIRLQRMDESQQAKANSELDRLTDLLSLFDSAYAFLATSEGMMTLQWGAETPAN